MTVPPSLEVCEQAFRTALARADATDDLDELAGALADCLDAAKQYPPGAHGAAAAAQWEVRKRVRQINAALGR